MMKLICALLLAGGMLTSLASCTTNIATFSVASTRNFDFTAAADYKVDSEKTVSNMDGQYRAMLFFSFQEANMKEAMEGAIRKSGPGCVGLADATIYQGGVYTGIFNMYWYTVEGNPIYRH